MNKLYLILGIVFLGCAVLMAVLNLTLEPGKIWFDIGYGNMPWVPVVIFAVAGGVLLALAFVPGKKAEPQAAVPADPAKAALNKRFESIAWGCFLVMLGGFAFVPNDTVKSGWWSIGVGLIFLGLNAARYFNGLKMSGFTTFLGILSIIGGVLGLLGLEAVNGAILLIVLGGYLILKPWFEKRQLFGKAEE